MSLGWTHCQRCRRRHGQRHRCPSARGHTRRRPERPPDRGDDLPVVRSPSGRRGRQAQLRSRELRAAGLMCDTGSSVLGRSANDSCTIGIRANPGRPIRKPRRELDNYVRGGERARRHACDGHRRHQRPRSCDGSRSERRRRPRRRHQPPAGPGAGRRAAARARRRGRRARRPRRGVGRLRRSAEVWDRLGGLDVLVNNAGIGMRTVNPRFLTEPNRSGRSPRRAFAT